MRALILAAGLGTRLRPLTETVPKCLVPIHGRPLLDYWCELLLGSGAVERLLINTSWLADQVCAYVAESRWCDLIDLVHEEQLLGTGGTVLANRAWFGEGPFMVAHGDNLTLFNPTAFIERHRNRPAGSEMTMMTFTTDMPQSCGIVEVNGKGLVEAFHEKVADPPGNIANGAVYIFEPSMLKFLAGLRKPDIDLSTEVLPAFLGKICVFANTNYHRDIGTLESLQSAEREYAKFLVPKKSASGGA